MAGPDAIPVIVDEQAAQQDPELAVLSVMAHGHEDVGLAIAQAIIRSASGLEDERSRLYFDLAVASISEAARRALEALMKSGSYEYQSEFARKYVAQGRQEGRMEGELMALLEILDARGLTVDDTARQRILACTDPAQLKLWLREAVTARSVQELFERKP